MSAKTVLMISSRSVRRRTVSLTLLSASSSAREISRQTLKGIDSRALSVILRPLASRVLPSRSLTGAETAWPFRKPASLRCDDSRMMRISSFWSLSSLSISVCSMSSVRLSLSKPLREKTRAPITTPSTPGGTRREVSRTSPAFSPKMARNNFSSGESCVSPFGVILPTRMSLGLTSAPIRIIPLSSRSLRASSPRLGISSVISSLPSLVSRATHSNSSM